MAFVPPWTSAGQFQYESPTHSPTKEAYTTTPEGSEDESDDDVSLPAEVTSAVAAAGGVQNHKASRGIFSGPPRNGRRFKGVRQRKWGRCVCEIRDAIGKRIWLGSFDSEEKAARVYDMAARILQGEGAWLNFPNETPGPVTLPRSTVRTLLKHRANIAFRQGSASGSKGASSPPRTPRQEAVKEAAAAVAPPPPPSAKPLAPQPSLEDPVHLDIAHCPELPATPTKAAEALRGVDVHFTTLGGTLSSDTYASEDMGWQEFLEDLFAPPPPLAPKAWEEEPQQLVSADQWDDTLLPNTVLLPPTPGTFPADVNSQWCPGEMPTESCLWFHDMLGSVKMVPEGY